MRLRSGVLAVACALVLCVAGASAVGTVYEAPAWEANGSVTATVRAGSSVYIGGSFTYVGPHTGAAVLATADDPTPDSSFPIFEGGTVRSIVDDGNGGFYVGGDFAKVSGLLIPRLAHVFADGSVDTSWQPAPNNIVYHLVRSGNMLYAAGEFITMGGQPRGGLASFDMATKTLTDWHPSYGASANGIAVVGSRFYVAGSVNFTPSTFESGLFMFDTVGAGHFLERLAYCCASSLTQLGTTIYLQGSFSVPASPANNIRVAAFDGMTGARTPFAIPGQEPGPFVSDGAMLWSQVGGDVRAFDPATGAQLRSWPDSGGFLIGAGGGRVYSQLDDPQDFSGVSGIRALDGATGAVLPWTLSLEQQASDLIVSGDRVVVGGSFIQAGGVRRRGFAELDAATGRATSFDPVGEFASARPIAATETTVYVMASGQFAGQARYGLAAFELGSHALLPWAPQFECAPTKCSGGMGILQQASLADGRMYVAGFFDSVNGVPRVKLAAVDAVTGATLPFTAPETLATIAVLLATPAAVYVGGNFTALGGASRRNLAALDPITGEATSWNPSPDGVVTALALRGDRMYVGGDFNRISGNVLRPRVAAVSTATGALQSWAPAVNAAPIYGIAAGGNIVLLATGSGEIAGKMTQGLTALDATTGALVPLPPGGNQRVASVATNDAGDWFLFGLRSARGYAFSTTPGLDHSGIAAYTVGAALARPPSAPTAATASAGDAQASVSFAAPSTDGGSAITTYRVTAYPGGQSASGPASPIVVHGLANGTSYTFRVRATNAAGTSPPSPASNAVLPRGRPGAPGTVVATAGDGYATIAFEAPATDGGAAIAYYTATASSGELSASSTGSPITMYGLANGESYTFTVTATNAAGTGASSDPSGPVVPVGASRPGTNPPPSSPEPRPEPPARTGTAVPRPGIPAH